MIGRIRSRPLSALCAAGHCAGMDHRRCRAMIRNVHSTMLKKAYHGTGVPKVRIYNGANATRGHKGSRSTFVKFTPVGSPGVTIMICMRGKN